MESSKKRTPRQTFASFKRSRAGLETIKSLLRNQLYMCPSCYANLDDGYHVHHLEPISSITDPEDPRIFSESNLVLLCPKCNLKQGNKVDTRFD